MGFTRPQSGRTFARLPEVHKVEVALRTTPVLTAGRNRDLSGVYFCTHLAAGRS